MTPEAAIYQFLSGFGIPAYASTSVPEQDGPEWEGFPYLTYDLVLPDLFEQGNMTVNLWYRTTREADPNAKVREIGQAIPQRAKVPIACDGGAILISRGSPWAQPVNIDQEDDMVKKRLLNVTIESAYTEQG